MSDYQKIRPDPGPDLNYHDALASGIPASYQEIFLSQQDRTEGMKYFDSVMSEVQSLRIKELADAEQLKIRIKAFVKGIN